MSKRRSQISETGEHHLVSEAIVEPPEYVQEQLIKNVHNLVVMVIDLHFQVQTGVLGKVSVGVGVLRPEDGSNLVHPPHITRDAHLFSELRTLGAIRERLSNRECREDPNLSEISGPTEVVHFKHGSTGLGGRRLELRRLNFYGRCQQSVTQRASFAPA